MYNHDIEGALEDTTDALTYDIDATVDDVLAVYVADRGPMRPTPRARR